MIFYPTIALSTILAVFCACVSNAMLCKVEHVTPPHATCNTTARNTQHHHTQYATPPHAIRNTTTRNTQHHHTQHATPPRNTQHHQQHHAEHCSAQISTQYSSHRAQSVWNKRITNVTKQPIPFLLHFCYFPSLCHSPASRAILAK
jgi:hypothetical protein